VGLGRASKRIYSALAGALAWQIGCWSAVGAPPKAQRRAALAEIVTRFRQGCMDPLPTMTESRFMDGFGLQLSLQQRLGAICALTSEGVFCV
jgi:hypothetical protein